MEQRTGRPCPYVGNYIGTNIVLLVFHFDKLFYLFLCYCDLCMLVVRFLCFLQFIFQIFHSEVPMFFRPKMRKVKTSIVVQIHLVSNNIMLSEDASGYRSRTYAVLNFIEGFES